LATDRLQRLVGHVVAFPVVDGDETMNLVPLGDRLIVRRLDAAEKTAGGIVLPDSARDNPQQGRVLSVGDGPLLASGRRAMPEVKEGDRVVFGSYAGDEVKIDGDALVILRSGDVLAILK
jgi:chaperonin GroES